MAWLKSRRLAKKPLQLSKHATQLVDWFGVSATTHGLYREADPVANENFMVDKAELKKYIASLQSQLRILKAEKRVLLQPRVSTRYGWVPKDY